MNKYMNKYKIYTYCECLSGRLISIDKHLDSRIQNLM